MSKSTPKIIVPTLAKKLLEEGDAQVAAYKPQVAAKAAADSGISEHRLLQNPDDPKHHITDKIYMFPESYNALRRELVDSWPILWAKVSYNMAYRAEDFVNDMNGFLDLKIQFDTGKVDAICQEFLDALRVKRSVSKLH